MLCVYTVYSVLYSEIALSWKPFGVGHAYIYTFLLRMIDTVTSQSIDFFSWDTLYKSGSVEVITIASVAGDGNCFLQSFDPFVTFEIKKSTMCLY
jgi:hypothetical protein